MKVICGLGNPGPSYENTRHNVGWWVVEAAQEDWRFPDWTRSGSAWLTEGRIGAEPVLLVEPLTFMNRSGDVLAPLAGREDFDVARDLLVVVDDVSLPTGSIRFRAHGSPGGHNGLKSVESALRTREYARLRIGVGAPPPGTELVDWVLGEFDVREEEQLDELLTRLPAALRVWVEEGVEAAANRFNG